MTKELKYSLPDFYWFSFPTKDIINFWLEHNLVDSPWLLMHTFLCRILTLYLSKNLPNDIEIDLDLALSLTTIYHFSRQEADYWKIWKSKDEETNKFMEQNSDIDYAIFEAMKYWFDESIIEWTKHFIINPKTRENYFPNETLETNWNINWTRAIPMLASWLTTWSIINTKKRFDDLKNRRSWEIWKLELDNIKEKLNSWINIWIPKQILDVAIRENNFDVKSENELLDLIKSWEITNEIMWLWILLWYEEYANKIINEYCKLCGIDDFYSFLTEWLCLVKDEEEKNKIKLEFEKYLNRPLQEDEIIPYLPWIELVFKRLSFLKIKEFREKYKNRIIKILKNLESITNKLKNK